MKIARIVLPIWIVLAFVLPIGPLPGQDSAVDGPRRAKPGRSAETVAGQKPKPPTLITIRASRDATYGQMKTAVAALHGAGFPRVGLCCSLPKRGDKRAARTIVVQGQPQRLEGDRRPPMQVRLRADQQGNLAEIHVNEREMDDVAALQRHIIEELESRRDPFSPATPFDATRLHVRSDDHLKFSEVRRVYLAASYRYAPDGEVSPLIEKIDVFPADEPDEKPVDSLDDLFGPLPTEPPDGVDPFAEDPDDCLKPTDDPFAAKPPEIDPPIIHPPNPGPPGIVAPKIQAPRAEDKVRVAMALDWLAAHQKPDGSWSFDHQKGPCQGRCENPGTLDAPNAATGLALLAFLGAAETHKGGEHKETIGKALEYLLQHQKKQPDHGGSWHEPGGTMYSHGLCAIAMCEAYAMTHDNRLMEPAQAGIDFIGYAQDPVGGGWRYQPRQAGDTSVLVWQLLALKSAHMAYLKVPPETVKKADKFLDSVQADAGAKYGYTGPGAGMATTSIGLLSRMYLGRRGNEPALARGIAVLDEAGPSESNFYFNYFATRVVRDYEGEMWKRWNPQMRDLLIESQATEGHEAGSWYVAGDHGSRRGGRVYCTAMGAMILEVPHWRRQWHPPRVEEEFPL